MSGMIPFSLQGVRMPIVGIRDYACEFHLDLGDASDGRSRIS